MEIFGLSIKAKVSGVWKLPLIKVKVSGNWVFVKQVWTKISGTWKRSWVSNVSYWYNYSSALNQDFWRCGFLTSIDFNTGVTSFAPIVTNGLTPALSNTRVDNLHVINVSVTKTRTANASYPNGRFTVEFRISSNKDGRFDGNTANNIVANLEGGQNGGVNDQFVKSITFAGITLRRSGNPTGINLQSATPIKDGTGFIEQFYWSWIVNADVWNAESFLGTDTNNLKSLPISIELGYN